MAYNPASIPTLPKSIKHDNLRAVFKSLGITMTDKHEPNDSKNDLIDGFTAVALIAIAVSGIVYYLSGLPTS